MNRKYPFSVGEYYHLYNRGVEKRNVFIDKKDWERFLKLLYVANSNIPFRFTDIENKSINEIERGDPIVAIGAYVLMPNHFHILVKEIIPNGLSIFVQKISTGYSMYFNKKYERVGSLLQGRFKAQHIKRDEHLKFLYAYIHLNPVKLVEPKWQEIGIKNKNSAIRLINNYRYSSYEDYCGSGREESRILSKEEFPSHFSDTHNFKVYVDEWLSLREHT